MEQETLPDSAFILGIAINPLDPRAGIQTAADTVGAERVKTLAAQIEYVTTLSAAMVSDMLMSAWRNSSESITSARQVMSESSHGLLVTAYAARLYAQSQESTNSFNPVALDQIAPVVRTLSGLPSRQQVDKAMGQHD